MALELSLAVKELLFSGFFLSKKWTEFLLNVFYREIIMEIQTVNERIYSR